MKKLALIGSYCDTVEKQDVLYQNIVKLKSLGVDILLLSPLPTDPKIINTCDFYFQTKENPLLSWPQFSHVQWRGMTNSLGENIVIERFLKDYGYAGLYQIKKLGEIGLTFDYEIFYQMIYDVVLDDQIVLDIQSNAKNLIYPRRDPKNPETIWKTTLHFMIFDRKTMKSIAESITLDDYLEKNIMPEDHAINWINDFNVSSSSHPIKDQIFYFSDTDLFNYSKDTSYNLFWGKNEYEPAVFIFTHLEKPLVLKVNDVEYRVNTPWIPVCTPFYEIKKLLVQTIENEQDYLEEYQNTERNIIAIKKT